MKKYSEDMLKADQSLKKVRQQIKEYAWEKQNQREGFTETFKPLISQFEDPGKDSKTQNIFSQNQKMLQNQLALTEGIRANQKAITDGFSQFERLADMQELPGVDAIENGENDKDDQARAPLPKEDKTSIVNLDLEKNFDANDIFTLGEFGYKRPNEFYDSNNQDLEKDLGDLNSDIKTLTGQINGRKRSKNPDVEYLALTLLKEEQKATLMKYRNIMRDYFKSLEYKVGQGLFSSPQELLQRFELLNGSLAAGNNGVLPEYIQLAHGLRDHGFINNTQLNKILKKII